MVHKTFTQNHLVTILVAVLILSGCQFSASINGSHSDDVPVFIPPTIIPPETPSATDVEFSFPILSWLNPQLPEHAVNQLMSAEQLEFTDNEKEALVKFQHDSGHQIGSWIYLAVSPFHSFRRDISEADLLSLWQGEQTSSMNDTSLYLSGETLTSISTILGKPSGDQIIIIESGEFSEDIWSNPSSLAILPFEELSLDWKVLPVDGIDPLSVNFNIDNFLLAVPIFIDTGDIPTDIFQFDQLVTNYDPSKLSSVAMTGVTALVRGTATIMEEKGITYPAGDIKDTLASASITHISNEVPFTEECPSPDPNQESLYFCSKDSYIELLEEVGADIIELSGDHFSDQGPKSILHTIDLYSDRDWKYYGGGEKLQAGLNAVFLEHNGNSFAFIGCNGKLHEKYAMASDTIPGASRCDYDWMSSEIMRLDRAGYIVIATLQHEEVDSFYSIAIQQQDFRRLGESGATIVSGSQSHHPQAFEYTGSSFIHYGLGNLFFDQWYLATYNPSSHSNKDKSFIDIHYFYNDTHINTRLVSLQFIDLAKPRLMTDQENELLLREIFPHSSWRGQPIFIQDR